MPKTQQTTGWCETCKAQRLFEGPKTLLIPKARRCQTCGMKLKLKGVMKSADNKYATRSPQGDTVQLLRRGVNPRALSKENPIGRAKARVIPEEPTSP